MELLIFLHNPEPKDPNELSQEELQVVGADELHVGFSAMDKEQRRRVLENTAFLMKLQLRKVIEETLRSLQEEILAIKDYR